MLFLDMDSRIDVLLAVVGRWLVGQGLDVASLMMFDKNSDGFLDRVTLTQSNC